MIHEKCVSVGIRRFSRSVESVTTKARPGLGDEIEESVSPT